jgi:hypothetical protein
VTHYEGTMPPPTYVDPMANNVNMHPMPWPVGQGWDQYGHGSLAAKPIHGAFQDVNGDGLADLWTVYSTLVQTITPDTSSNAIDHISVAGTGTGSLIIANNIAATVGVDYTFAVDVQVLALAASANLVVKIEYYDSTDTLTTYGYATVSAPAARAVVSTHLVAPATTTKAKLSIAIEGGGSANLYGAVFNGVQIGG